MTVEVRLPVFFPFKLVTSICKSYPRVFERLKGYGMVCCVDNLGERRYACPEWQMYPPKGQQMENSYIDARQLMKLSQPCSARIRFSVMRDQKHASFL